MRRMIWVICLGLFLACCGGSLRAEPLPPQEVKGDIYPASGPPQETDKATARRTALVNTVRDWAKRSTLPASTVTMCTASLDKMSLAEVEKLFASIEVVGERGSNMFYSVLLRVSLDGEKLKAWTRQFEVESPFLKSRIMIVIPESYLDKPLTEVAGETKFIEVFIKNGFRLVDQKQVATIREKDLVKRAMKNDARELLAVAQSWGAEVLVIGEAFSQNSTRLEGLDDNKFPTQARIEARVILCDTGEILASGDANAMASEPSSAVSAKASIRNAANDLANKLVQDLLVANRNSAAHSSIRLVLNGADFEHKILLKQILENMHGFVTEVHEISYLENRAEFEITTTYKSSKLLEEIYLKAKSEGLKLKVTDQSAKRCVVEVVPDTKPPDTKPVEK